MQSLTGQRSGGPFNVSSANLSGRVMPDLFYRGCRVIVVGERKLEHVVRILVHVALYCPVMNPRGVMHWEFMV